jgi:AcrR family transcriptional regulator
LAVIAEAPEALSLRELARRAGVSPAAVYRHFPDKAALLAALAAQGLAMLGRAQHQAFSAAGGGLDGFAATGVAYVHFALAHPALFRLTFATGGVAEDGEVDAMTFLRENARQFAPPGFDPQIFALQAWSLVHGLATLILDGQLPADAAMIDRTVRAHLEQATI